MTPLNDLVVNSEATANISVILATFWIVTEVFPSKTRGPTTIGQYADSQLAYIEHSDLVERILVLVSRKPITRILLEFDRNYAGRRGEVYDFYYHLNDEEHFYRFGKIKKKAIWFLDSLKSFGRLEANLIKERNHYDRKGFFCIIYTGKEPHRLDTIRTIFDQIFQIYFINVNILMTIDGTVHVYTHFPFTKSKCYIGEPQLTGVFGLNGTYRYIANEKVGSNFFPKKLSNMWGCKVNVSTFTKRPFIELEYNKTTKEVIRFEGIEGRLMMVLASLMNFSIQIVEVPEKQIGNTTTPGLVKMLIDGVTNISILGLWHDKPRSRLLQLSYPYLNSPVKFCIPVGKTMGSTERLFRPFRIGPWIYLSCSIFIAIFTIYVLKAWWAIRIQEFVLGHRNRTPFTNVWRTLYGCSIAGSVPRENFSRFILGIWILYTFILRSAYVAQLFLILQDSTIRHNFNTVNEILKQNLSFYSNPVAIQILKDVARRDIHSKILNMSETSVLKGLDILAEDENANFSIVLSEYNIRFYNQHEKNRSLRINILREPLIYVSYMLFMRRHSYLEDEINEHLLKIMSAGLIKKFEYSTFRGHQIHNAPEKQYYFSIPLSLISGIFFLQFSLLILCAFVFLLELCSQYFPRLRKVIDFLNL